MRAGRLRHRVTLLRPEISRDALGTPQTTWIDAGAVWAGVEPLRGREFHAARQEYSDVAVRVVIRYRAGIGADWRVDYDGRVLELVAPPINPDERNRELQLMCRILA